MGNVEFWESSIRNFEKADQAHPPKLGSIVFTGSSSILFWHTLADDMKPLDVINRGFGGSQIAQVNHYVARIVINYRPRAVVLYAGEMIFRGPGRNRRKRSLATSGGLLRPFIHNCRGHGFTTSR
jgi:hypothetical protein